MSDHEKSFVEELRSFSNHRMWDNMWVEGDGEWIAESLQLGTLDIAHDGSYQPEISTEVCSAAVIAKCKATGREMIVSFAERSRHATNYSVEILGAIATQLILNAATRNMSDCENLSVVTHCDNKGVLNHGGKAEAELKEKQAQFDVLHVLKGLVSASKVLTTFNWVEGHSVEKKD